MSANKMNYNASSHWLISLYPNQGYGQSGRPMFSDMLCCCHSSKTKCQKKESRNPLKPEKDNQCFFTQGNRNESNEPEENVANESAVQRAMQRKGKEYPGERETFYP